MRVPSICPILLCWTTLVCANVEKTIFIAPKAIHIPIEHPNLEDLRLDTLTPSHLALRRLLTATFPNNTHAKGTEAWFLLDGLRQDQRYEVRICWSATQPTAFSLYTYPIEQVFNDTALISALAVYSEARQSMIRDQANFNDHITPQAFSRSIGTTDSVLFFQVFAAADYFTTDKKLMREVPPVEVDIILDPYFLNVLPQSLLPTAAYLGIIAFTAWYLSKIIWILFRSVADYSLESASQNNAKKDE